MAISDFSNIEWVYVPYTSTFASKFPKIWEEMQKQEISNVLPKIYISNVDLNENNNLDSTLQLVLDETSNQVDITGDWSSFEGLVVINDEILYLSNPNYLFSQYTRFDCLRGQKFTNAFLHAENTRVRSIMELDVIDYNYTHKSNTTNTSIFAPVLSDGNIVFVDDVKKWIITSNVKEYDLAKNKPIYIFEGANKEMKCSFQGYIYDWDTDAKSSEITLMFKDEFTLVNSKDIDFSKTYINQYTIDVIEDILNATVIYMNGTDKEHYGKLDRISTTDYDTYGSILSYICEVKCLRLSYDEYGYVRVYSDLFKETDTFLTELEVRDSIDLVDINETTENTLVLNKFTSEFKNRFPYYNRNQFLDGSVLRYINFRYKLPNQSITLMNTEGFKTFDIDMGTNIKYLTIGDYILLKDTVTQLEFRCKVYDISGNAATFIGGFDRDRAWNPRGKQDYLISNGYTSLKYFDVYYSELNMQTIFALNQEKEGENISSNLKIPILPEEEIEYSCTFGSFETNDFKFSGIVEEIENIYGTLDGGTDLFYLKEYEQSETGIPVYLLTNKMAVNGSGNGQLYYYDSFDNSDVQVTISQSNDNDSNITLKVKNNLTTPITRNITPLETIGRILKINSVDWSLNTFTGDVLVLHEDNDLDDRTQDYYNLNSDVKWNVESKFQEGTNYYVVLDKPYPIGDDNVQMKFIKYKYDKIIHLNELRIMGNPVVEETQNIVKINADSIDKYDELEYKFDGKLTTIKDLKYSISYLYNNFAGLPNNYTRIIPFEAFFRPDIELLDVVKLYDSNIVDMDAEEVIIIEKSVSVSGDGEREEKYIGVTKAEHLSDLTTLDFESDKNFYTTLYPTEYNHTGNEGLETEIDDDVDNLYVSKESKVGNISVLKIPTEDYYGICQTNIRNDEKEFTIQVYGDKSIYNTSVFKEGNKSVIRVGSEYILVKSQTEATSTTTTINLEIIKRDIFGTGLYEITGGQILQICQITNFTDQDGMIVDGVIAVGSINGKIKFLESDLILDDYRFFSGDFSNRGFSLIDEDRGSKGDLFSIRFTEGTFDTLWTTWRMENTVLSLSFTDQEQSSPLIQSTWGGLGAGKKTITIKGLRLTSEKWDIIDDNYINIVKQGMLSYHDNHFYGYNGSTWKQLDNETLPDPYPGYADRVILPEDLVRADTGGFDFIFDNLYFNVSSSIAVPCLTQYNQLYTSNTSLNSYAGEHLIDVSSGAITISVNQSPSSTPVLGKTYEIIHAKGDVTSNNITIDGGSNSFYEIGSGTSLGTTLTINTTGGRVRLFATSSRWYVIEF